MLRLDDATRAIDALVASAAGWAGDEEMADEPGYRAEIGRGRDAFRRQVHDAASIGAIPPRLARRLAAEESGAGAVALLALLEWADETRRDLVDRFGPEDASRALSMQLGVRLVTAARAVRLSWGLDADAVRALQGWAECAYAAGLATDAQFDALTGPDYVIAEISAERFASAALPH
ncbi:MAG: hypothetical protein U0838_00335 [Chloroflexota bacterium]